ncbi:glutathione S-transferase [Sphingomicrobium flavum]|uniref:glutathione S-transferase n=1 Tax=Sphingomicrobium flavum TaxID=1229164 RepID=UPI0021ADB242|nr:glutathione S-transferase [Sphingomicrobium flavum]
MSVPILYSFRRCPYAMRARMALKASGVEVEHREILLRDKPPAMLEASPKGTVPVLVLPDGQVLEESLDVMHWALDQADPHGWLERKDDALIARIDGPFKHHLDRYKYAERHGTDATEHRGAAMEIVGELEHRLAARPFLCGDRWGMTDAAIMPFIRQFAAHDRTWFDAQPIPHLRQWLDAAIQSDIFTAIMHKHALWHE